MFAVVTRFVAMRSASASDVRRVVAARSRSQRALGFGLALLGLVVGLAVAVGAPAGTARHAAVNARNH
jgi:hypothetical protein